MTYRVVRSPLFTPSNLALARRYSDLAHAVADMGEGVVVASDDGRVVAFHERHLGLMQRRAVSAEG